MQVKLVEEFAPLTAAPTKTRTRQPGVNDSLNLWDYPLGEHSICVTVPFVGVGFLTSDFNDLSSDSGNATILKTDGSKLKNPDGSDAVFQVTRDGADIWPYWPSTLFYPNPADTQATFGVLYVHESWLINNGLVPGAHVLSVKYPKRLETADFARMISDALNQGDYAGLRETAEGKALADAAAALLKKVGPQ